LYPENFFIFKERATVSICNQDVYIVPWITKNETLTKEEIQGKDYIFGHFEVRNFSMVRGIVDTKSELTEDFFKKDTKLKGVFSGHYHLRNTKGFLKYLGSLTQLNWNDYDDLKGFYDFDGFKIDFIENITSSKYIKVKYNDEENTDRNIEVQGLFEHSKLLTDSDFSELLPLLSKHEVKTFINKHKDDAYEEMLYKMKKADVKTSIVNNQEMSELIGTDFIQNEETLEQKDTKSLIRDTILGSKPELLSILNELIIEIESETIGE
jgi:DNA repair exonuclease SbcCD nuclease subunit